MRTILFAFLLVGPIAFAQEDPFIVRADTSWPRFSAQLAHFDSLYASSGDFFSPDSIGEAWYNHFLPVLLARLDSVQLPWKDTIHVWFRVYCLPSGEIEHAIYSSSQLYGTSTAGIFETEFAAFVRTTPFPLQAAKRYSQCGSFRFPHTK